ncbi:hypothetical protein C8R44DRAFT_976568 [Mycena epipterygia]|nr:hypothetical protein C8R44DRAFT_976568 [Mycena epipterygia]
MSYRRVPNELWLEVFHNLFKEHLKNVSLTCRTFHRVSHHLLLANFDWFLSSSSETLEASMERLGFWCSDEIAPLVRSCRITTLGPRSSHSDSPYIVRRDEFFKRLPCFTGLQRIAAYRLQFTQQGLINLCGLPVLASLYIHACYFPQAEEILPNGLELKVSTFVFRNFNQKIPRGFVNHWTQLLHPNHLRELDVDPRGFFGNSADEETTNDTEKFLERQIDNLPSFPHVHKLKISTLHSTMSYNLAILSKFPGVRVFSVDGWSLRDDASGPRVQTPQILPVLAEYTGPYRALHIFLPRVTLTRLTISGCDIDDLITELKAIRPLDDITSLNVTFYDSMDHVTLNAMCGFFPRLAELYIHISFHLSEENNFEDDMNPEPAWFFNMVAESVTFPPTLERLAMSWVYRSDYIMEFERANPLPRFAYLRDALVARCPALTSLWLDGYNFLFRWRKFATKVIENTADNIYNTEIMRNDSDSVDFW